MDLFQVPSLPDLSHSIPLAARLAPQNWEDFVGQEHLVSPSSLLRRAIEADRLRSSIFFGPPGSGKTALAQLAAVKTQATVESLNAVTAGVAEIRQVVKRAGERKQANGQQTLLIVDEIHHFNRTQQDALLPDVERGNFTLIGLTTENPYFYVNAALISRSAVYEFKALQEVHLLKIFDRAMMDEEKGLGQFEVEISLEARKHMLSSSNGDARRLLNILELAVLTTPKVNQGIKVVDLEVAEASSQKKSVRYDKKGDEHYDTISAFIKSMRGSDPDAALYWMAKMLQAGEDPRFISRRIMIFAAEDVGNADPQAITVATSAARMVEMVGMPEARIPLAQAVTYVSCAPKSNASYIAIDKALLEVEKGPPREVPIHLKDASKDGKGLGHGKNYLYPYDYPEHHVKQIYMPNRVNFYEPTDQGGEAAIKKRLDEWRKKNPPQ